jgi:hypothetical protein
MFHRILVEEWQRALSIMSICLFFAVFSVNLLRVRRLSRASIERLENLPLEKDDHGANN